MVGRGVDKQRYEDGNISSKLRMAGLRKEE